MSSQDKRSYNRLLSREIEQASVILVNQQRIILGDPGADRGGERKSKRAGKYGTKKSKERREEPRRSDF